MADDKRAKQTKDQPVTPPLCYYRSLAEYKPVYGDYVVWAGWFATWHGLVSGFDREKNEVGIIFAGVPFLLFTLNDTEQVKSTKQVSLDKIRVSSKGNFAIMQHDYTQNASIWYV